MSSAEYYFEELAGEAEEFCESKEFPLMPEGKAYDMGRAQDGTPLVDPRILDSMEFFRNP